MTAGQSVVGDLARTAALQPDAVAVIGESGDEVTYGELWERALGVAGAIEARNPGSARPVALATRQPGADLLIGMAGILASGRPFVPIDGTSAHAPRLVAQLQPRLYVGPGDDPLAAECAPVTLQDAARSTPAPQPADPAPGGIAYVLFTSGSTGEPKGVEITHDGLARRAADFAKRYELTPTDRVLRMSDPTFDSFCGEVFPAFREGAALVVPPADVRTSLPRLAELVESRGVTVLELPTAFWRAWVDEVASGSTVWPSGVRLVSIAGEQAYWDTARAFRAFYGGRLVNEYGPTEVTVTATMFEVPNPVPEAKTGPLPIGTAMEGTGVHLLAGEPGRLEPVPAGEVGEIYLSGAGLARGYLGNPAATAAAFPVNPAPAIPGRAYRTGDLAVAGPDGFVFTGRVDRQVKVRGFRIELDAIEAALMDLDGVDAAAAAVAETPDGRRKRLCVFAVPGPDATLGEQQAADAIAGRLGRTHVPDLIRIVDDLPRTERGKTDYRALVASLDSGPDQHPEPAANGTESAVRAVWRDVLGVGTISLDDTFRELGGDSIAATQIAARLESALGYTVNPGAVFEHRTVRAMARHLAAAGGAAAAPLPPSRAVPARSLSFSQEQVLLIEAAGTTGLAYRSHMQLDIAGELQRDRLVAALEAVVRQHDVLRSTFHWVGTSYERRVHPGAGVALDFYDLSFVDDAEREAQLQELVDTHMARDFDPARLPLVRWLLVRMADDRHALLHSEHHLVHDGWSWRVFLADLAAAYEAAEPGALAPEMPARPFDTFVAQEAAWLATDAAVAAEEFWRRMLEGRPPAELTTDYPRPAERTHRGQMLRRRMSPEAYGHLVERARTLGVTPFSLMLSMFGVLMMEHTSTRDLTIGTAYANRDYPGSPGLIGMVVNMLPLRLDFSGCSRIEDAIRETESRVRGAIDHGRMPFVRLVEALRPPMVEGRPPFFDVSFSFHDSQPTSLRLGDTDVTISLPHNGTAKFDLNVVVVIHTSGQASIECEFDTGVFAPSSVETMLDQLEALLAHVVEGPDGGTELDAVPAVLGNDSVVAGPDRFADPRAAAIAGRPIIDSILRAAEEHADKPAVVGTRGTVTYRELVGNAGRIARAIRREIGEPAAEPAVAVTMKRGPDAVASMLGVMMAGATYVPIETEYPLLRRRQMIDQAKPVAIVADRWSAAEIGDVAAAKLIVEDVLAQAAPDAAPFEVADPPHTAYTMFTSGSTGKPKQVALGHPALANMAASSIEKLGIEPSDRVLQMASVSFDISLFEMMTTLAIGATLVVPTEDERSPGRRLASVINDHGATVVFLTPSVLGQQDASEHPDVRLVVTGAEYVPQPVVQPWLDAGKTVWNAYGPTEATVLATLYRCEPAEHDPPIGTPYHKTTIYVVGDDLEPRPIGCAGEICIGGALVGHGYVGDDALTDAKFVATPGGERVYRTGDLGRITSDGLVRFLGRVDGQVKVRGHRIELGEVESTIGEVPGVKLAGVRVVGSGADAYLAAYVQLADPGTSERAIREHLRQRLPRYMLPSYIGVLDAIPVTMSGKLDRSSLPLPQLGAPPQRRAPAQPDRPRGEVETAVRAAWTDVLGATDVEGDTDFFSLGGHSILAMRVAAAVSDALGVDVGIRDVFDHPTLDEFVAAVGEMRRQAADRTPGMVPA